MFDWKANYLLGILCRGISQRHFHYPRSVGVSWRNHANHVRWSPLYRRWDIPIERRVWKCIVTEMRKNGNCIKPFSYVVITLKYSKIRDKFHYGVVYAKAVLDKQTTIHWGINCPYKGMPPINLHSIAVVCMRCIYIACVWICIVTDIKSTKN